MAGPTQFADAGSLAQTGIHASELCHSTIASLLSKFDFRFLISDFIPFVYHACRIPVHPKFLWKSLYELGHDLIVSLFPKFGF